MSDRPKPKVGDVLWMAYGDSRDQARNHEVRVVAVGRKWATICPACYESPSQRSLLKFEWADPRMHVHAGEYSPNARIWPSREAWEREMERDRVWTAFYRSMEFYRLAPEVTAEDVREAARLLGLLDKVDEWLAREGK